MPIGIPEVCENVICYNPGNSSTSDSFPVLQGLKMQFTLLLRCGKKRLPASFCHRNKADVSLEPAHPSVNSRKINKPKIQFSLNLFWSNYLNRVLRTAQPLIFKKTKKVQCLNGFPRRRYQGIERRGLAMRLHCVKGTVLFPTLAS